MANWKKVVIGTGTSSQYIKGDGSFATYSAGVDLSDDNTWTGTNTFKVINSTCNTTSVLGAFRNTNASGYGLKLQATDGTSARYITTFNDKDDNMKARIYGDGSATFVGNLIVGSSLSTSTDTSLHIGHSGDTHLRIGEDSNNNARMSWDASENSLEFHLTDGGTARSNMLVLDSTGKVGIGTASPQKQLSVYADGTAPEICWEIAGNSGARNWAWRASGSNWGDFQLRQGTSLGGAPDTHRITISDGGNVGIGANAPAQILHLKGAVPSILFEDSTNGYLAYIGDAQDFLTGDSPGADSFGIRSEGDIRLGTGGNNLRMTINSSGNVGIGTASPSAKLDVQGTSDGSSLSIRDTDAFAVSSVASGAELVFGGTASSPHTVWMQNRHKSSGGFSYPVAINPSGGNVGIGTSSPTGYKLVVHNSSEDLLKLHNTTDGLDSLISFTNSGGTLGRIQGIDNGGLAFDTGNNAGGINSNVMFISNDAKVGIGTTSPTGLLNLYKSNASAVLTIQRREVDGALTTGDIIGQIDFVTNDDSYNSGNNTTRATIKADIQSSTSASGLIFETGNSNSATAQAMYIAPNGAVSIGMPAASMSKTLHVQSNTGSAGTPNGLMLTNTIHGSDSQIYMYAENDSGVQSSGVIKYDPDLKRMKLIGSGNVGLYIDHTGHTNFESNINLPDSIALSLGSSTDSQIFNDGSNLKFRNNTSDQDIIFLVNDGGSTNTEVMRIDASTSRVGIGTSSPDALLHIEKAGGATLRIANSSDGMSDESHIGTIEFEGDDESTNRAGVMAKISSLYSDTGSGDAIDGSANEGGSLAFYTSIATTVGGSQTLNERMRIENNGNVGIGTKAPRQKLHISSSSVGQAKFHSTGSSGSRIYISDSSAESAIMSQNANLIFEPVSGTASAFISANKVFLGKNINGGTSTTELAGYGVLDDDSQRYGNYGWLTFNAPTNNFTSAARGWAITNAYLTSNFAILKSSDASSEPYLSTDGIAGTGTTAPFRIDANGEATFGGGVSMPTGNVSVGGKLNVASSVGIGALGLEKTFSIAFADGVANQKAQIQFTKFWGELEISVSGTFANQNNAGVITKKYGLGVQNYATYANESRYTESLGVTANNFAIGEVTWDTTNSRYYIPIVHRVSTGNTCTVRVRCLGGDASQTDYIEGLTVSSVYTTDTTSYDKPEVSLVSPIGINTATPEADLHIHGQTGIRFTDSNQNANEYAEIKYDNAGNTNLYINNDWTNSNALINFQLAGSTKMAVRGDGNVGIGSTSPTDKLYITDGASAYTGQDHRMIQLKRNASNDDSNVGADTSAFCSMLFSNNSNGFTIGYGGTSDRFRFLDGGGVERLSIKNGGNVGIGTTNPSYKLDITGPATENGSTLRLNDVVASKNSKHLLIQRSSSTASIGIAGSQANDPLWISRSGGYDLMVVNAGNVGIGTSTPDSYNASADNLVVYENSNSGITIASSTTGTGSLYFADGTTGDEAYKGSIEYVHGSTNELRFRANSVLGMTLDPSKSVTIGGSLDIGDDSSGAHRLTIHSRYDSGPPSLHFRTGHPNNANVWTLGKIQVSDDGNYNGSMTFYTSDTGYNGTVNAGMSQALELDSSQNATFSGNITAGTTISLAGGASTDSYLRFDGNGGDTYIHYNANDMIDVYTGGDIAMRIKDDDVEFNGAIKSGSTEIVSSSGQILHGHHGYATRIKVLPFDFIPNDDDADANVASNDGESEVGKVNVTNLNLETHANYDIPRGYKVTACMLYGSDPNNTVKIYEANIDDGDAVEQGVGNINTEINCTDFNATATNYVVLKWAPTATSDFLYGGYITIAQI